MGKYRLPDCHCKDQWHRALCLPEGNLGGRGRRSPASKDRRSAALELQAVKLNAGRHSRHLPMRPCCMICSARSLKGSRSRRSLRTGPTTPGAVVTPSRTGARMRSCRPGAMPHRRRKKAPGRQAGTKICAPSSASAEASGGAGAGITAEAGPKPR